MVDFQSSTMTVCCMCGDVGFPDKLFRCHKCRNRFQHSYCSNYYYSESSERPDVCDWCQTEERSGRHGAGTAYSSSSSKKSGAVGLDAAGAVTATSRSDYSGDKIKQQHHHNHDHHRDDQSGAGGERGKNPTGAPSPRPTTRRYKLLKDVMC